MYHLFSFGNLTTTWSKFCHIRLYESHTILQGILPCFLASTYINLVCHHKELNHMTLHLFVWFTSILSSYSLWSQRSKSYHAEEMLTSGLDVNSNSQQVILRMIFVKNFKTNKQTKKKPLLRRTNIILETQLTTQFFKCFLCFIQWYKFMLYSYRTAFILNVGNLWKYGLISNRCNFNLSINNYYQLYIILS